mgnify:CR=1 FL=1
MGYRSIFLNVLKRLYFDCIKQIKLRRSEDCINKKRVQSLFARKIELSLINDIKSEDDDITDLELSPAQMLQQGFGDRGSIII